MTFGSCASRGDTRPCTGPRSLAHVAQRRPVGTPTGSAARVTVPHAGQTQPVQLILSHDRMHRWEVGHLMPVWLGILARPRAAGTETLPRLDRDHVYRPLRRVPTLASGPRAPVAHLRFRPLGVWRERGRVTVGGLLDGGRDELCESCWSRSSRCWTVASSAATRASRAWMYAWTATGVCSHSSGGKGGMVFMGLDHTRLDTGWQVSRTATT